MRHRYGLMNFSFAGIALLILVSVLSGCNQVTPSVVGGGSLPETGQAQSNGRIVLTVNGRNLSASECARRLDTLSAQGVQNPAEELIREELLADYAERIGIAESREFQEKLFQIRRELLISGLKEHLRKGYALTDEEIASYYNTHPEKFREPEEIRVEYLVMETREDAEGAAGIAAAAGDLKKAAEEIQQNSGKPSVSRYVAMDFFSRGSTDPEFEEAAFGLKVNQISDVVKTENGYYIIRVTGRKPSYQRKLADVKKEIEELLRDRHEQQQYQLLIEKLENSAIIDWKDGGPAR